jgi:transcriptional regulator with XRE-family HTH domain
MTTPPPDQPPPGQPPGPPPGETPREEPAAAESPAAEPAPAPAAPPPAKPKPPTTPLGRAEHETRRWRRALADRIGGTPLRRIEREMGVGRDYLRHLMSGRIEMKAKYLLGVLAVLEVPPYEFFGQLYGLARPEDLPLAEPAFPRFGELRRTGETEAVRFIAKKLVEAGIIDEETAVEWVKEFMRLKTEF